ncbi:hypothetical protein R3P38DRAFT_2575028, partial [Favolaschia claudopus]
YNYVLLDGRRITSTQRNRGRNFGSCLIYSEFNEEGFAGELQIIFKHSQDGVSSSSQTLFGFVRWMKRSMMTPLTSNQFIWDDFPELGIETWEYNAFAPQDDPEYPPVVLPIERIKCQVARGVFRTRPRMWVTTTLDRVLCRLV